MSQTSQELITESVVSTAERWESLTVEDFGPFGETYEIDPLEVKVNASLDGTVREIILVMTTGGPHIEVNVSNQTVTGYWGGDSHTTHFRNEDLANEVENFYIQYWEDNILA